MRIVDLEIERAEILEEMGGAGLEPPYSEARATVALFSRYPQHARKIAELFGCPIENAARRRRERC